MERVVIFDVLGTLFSLDAVRGKLSAIGAPAATLEAWFERTLHGALTLTTVGEFRPFREVARAALKTTLAQLELDVAYGGDPRRPERGPAPRRRGPCSGAAGARGHPRRRAHEQWPAADGGDSQGGEPARPVRAHLHRLRRRRLQAGPAPVRARRQRARRCGRRGDADRRARLGRRRRPRGRGRCDLGRPA